MDVPSKDEIERARRLGVAVLTPVDPAYPPLLKGSADPPGALYVRGSLEADDRLAVAVVGARRATPYGLDLATRLGRDLAASGFTVVSGLARGIDAAAHRGALEGGGRTLAVLGSGVDRIYPEEHAALAQSIAARGAVISEMPLGTAPKAGHFPLRNRIIASLGWGTVVVEAARDSGSLITANLALQEGRLVFAVPGLVGEPNAFGTNALLRAGAHCCRSAEDVIEDLGAMVTEAAAGIAAQRAAAGAAFVPEVDGRRGSQQTAGLSAAEGAVLGALSKTRGLDVDALGKTCGVPPGELQAALLNLELRGLARAIPGPRYLRG
jgi:DNA processing protein